MKIRLKRSTVDSSIKKMFFHTYLLEIEPQITYFKSQSFHDDFILIVNPRFS
jgi:hypothetical protein